MGRLYRSIVQVVLTPYLAVLPVTVADARLWQISRLRKWVVPIGLLPCAFLAASMVAHTQGFPAIPPPPFSAAVARQQIRTMLEKFDAGNRQQTVKTLFDLALWYRDLLDEELIAAWRRDDRANLPEVIDPLADKRVAAEIVEFSWRKRRAATFSPAYAPMLGSLMKRYAESAQPFLGDLLGSTAKGEHALDLSQPEIEAVCRILLDMPDIREWRKSALQILPRYRRDVQGLLDRDLHTGDREKMNRAMQWLTDLAAIDAAFDARGRTTAATPGRLNPAVPTVADIPDGPMVSVSSPADPLSKLGPINAARQSTAAHAGVILTPLDPAKVDDTSRSLNGNTPALIDFVNRSRSAVDIYWIDYGGDRRLITAGLAVGATRSEGTFLTHPFLVVVSGTGGTAAQDSGTPLAGFEAVTPNVTRDRANRDIAIITDAATAANAPRSRPGNDASGSQSAGANQVAAAARPGAGRPDGPYRVGNGVSAPAPIFKVEPEYSEPARKLKAEGVVLLYIVVRPNGFADNFKVLRPMGYGLDEKAIEAVRKWRFTPGMKDGIAVPVEAQIEVNFRYGTAETATGWYSGPMVFASEAGLAPPVVKDGTMPKPGRETSDERVVLEFTVDSSGSVWNIHAIQGSESAAELLTRHLATWKFRPALKDNQPVEAIGRVRFVKGQGDEAAQLALTPPAQSNPPAPERAPATSVTGTAPQNDLLAKLTVDMLTGSYRRDPLENDWHHGTIATDPLRWTNDAGVSWRLTPDLVHGLLQTGPDNLYYNTGPGRVFYVILRSGPAGDYLPAVDGFQFNGEFYRRLDSQPAVASPVPAPAALPGTMDLNGVYRVGNGVSAPSVLKKVEPEYSEVAAKLHVVDATVVLYLVVQPDGTARDFKVLRSMGYGLDEKAIEAARKWRFRPGMKAGNAVPVGMLSEANFHMLHGPGADTWTSGPMGFASEAGVAPPVVQDGTMPTPSREFTNESVVIDFTVDSSGWAQNIHAIHGSESASKLLTRYLATWKFQPAVKDNRSVEANGRVRFVKGQGDGAANLALSPPPPQSKPVPPPGPPQTARVRERKVKDQGEYNIYNQVLKDTDPLKQIQDLDTWTRKYPDSDYKNDDRPYLYLQAYNKAKQAAEVLDLGGRLMSNGLKTLYQNDQQILTILSTICVNTVTLPVPTSAQLAVGENAAVALQEFIPKFFTAANKPPAVSEADWNQGRADLEKTAKDALLFIVTKPRAGAPSSAQTGRGAPVPELPATKALSLNTGEIRTLVNATDGQRYVWIPPGAFTMGCSPGDTECNENEKPPHVEQIAKGFWLGQTEVTQAAYVRVTGGNPSNHKGEQLPVESLIWDHAANYCRAIGGRLPTEAEWEYAARAGVAWARYGSLDDVAWHAGNSGNATHPVALKQPNAFGLYDMLGNVWEYVAGSYPGSSDKILRGGAPFVDLRNTRASTRGRSAPTGATGGRGFRCAGEWPAAENTVPAAVNPVAKITPGTPPPTEPPATPPVPAPAGPGSAGPDVDRRQAGAPRVVKRVAPEYSAEALAAGYQGTVSLYADIDPSGIPEHIRVMQGLGLGLDEKAVEAVRQWRFEARPGAESLTGMMVRVPFQLNPGGPWRASRELYGFAAADYRPDPSQPLRAPVLSKPVLSRYVGPDAVVCEGNAGAVAIDFAIEKNGVPTHVEVARGARDPLGAAAIRAVESWRFLPGRRDGKAISATGEVELRCGASENGGPAPVIDPLGAGVSAPRLMYKKEPDYSEEARQAKYQGAVLLVIEIAPDGYADSMWTSHMLGLGLDEKAMEAVLQWRFKPAMKDGNPVRVRAQVEVNFRLL